jgi:hypothetical protein
MSPTAQLRKIKEILERHRGKGTQVSAGDIGPEIGIREDATHVQVRGLILDAIQQYGLPVAGGSRGYYLISNQSELQAYLANIDGRIEEMQKRRDFVSRAFKKYYKK